MGRGRGPKFSFPIPGRKHNVEKALDDTSSIPSISSHPEWSLRPEDSSYPSKAERLLGTTSLPIHPSPRSQSSLPQSPGYMTVTVSEASFGSEYTDRASSIAVEDGGYIPAQRPGMVARPSSNLLGNIYHGDGRRGSNCSSISKRLHLQASNSTMRSYYDPQKSPLSVSQQTSASAVRDMALRKGRPQVAVTNEQDNHVSSMPAHYTSEETKKQNRKSKPARLDLSKFFPKPKGSAAHDRSRPLLSPNKLVNSPTAMSTASEYFPRPMTREPTPTPRASQAKLTKSAKRPEVSQAPPARSSSPVRLHKPDIYDSAKINVRRPPRGIQHWFDGLNEDSDEDDNEAPAPSRTPVPADHRGPYKPPVRKSSLGRLLTSVEAPSNRSQNPQHAGPLSRKEQYTHANQLLTHRLNSPSQYSIQSHSSLVSSKTKSSAFSRTNLQDSSVLSISSSEEEEDEAEASFPRKYAPVRDSIVDHEGEIIIGKAQAYEVRRRPSGRAPSESKLSMISTSTNAATIEVMYSPEPYSPRLSIPRPYGSRRSSHVRQPSVIREDGDEIRPQTSSNARPPSASSISARSARTSRSEPRSRTEQHKLMAVTEEEEALLEMMRRKRAAMAKHSFTEGYKTAIMQEARQKTPPEKQNAAPRTSAFLSLDSPSTAPTTTAAGSSSRRFLAGSASPLLLPPLRRGRPRKSTQEGSVGTSILRDSSSCDSNTAPSAASTRPDSPSSHTSLAYHLPPASELSPLDPTFPSPARTPTTASIASPTTTSHASPLPSPVTPGLRHGEADLHVQVASSEPSCNGDEDVAVTSTGVIEPLSGSIKTDTSRNSQASSHQRRRTASSGADVSFSPGKHFPAPPKQRVDESHEQLRPVSEAGDSATLNTPSIIEPKLPRKSSRRTSSVTGSVTGSRHGSIVSRSSRTSSPATGTFDRRISSRGGSVKRESVTPGTISTRCSVSEDVLAAWGSLGGWRDYDSGRIGFAGCEVTNS
ncbi:hypothetical protein K469DRAFT_754627 [Zopfia rhizophila CBS 207.26]|uniref:Uncharacterized protein n=1 Tax=Zopfia rhizophila CBS 207.26 TaxID=1314779 RepID=A0A6A6DFQ8_9PEZI|nr:hypothetical protein K469DRAFT_754627 [Zopfia rhizophila CBS 207.26]